jgi:hypothetical protein
MEHNRSSKGRRCTVPAMMPTNSVPLVIRVTVHMALRLLLCRGRSAVLRPRKGEKFIMGCTQQTTNYARLRCTYKVHVLSPIQERVYVQTLTWEETKNTYTRLCILLLLSGRSQWPCSLRRRSSSARLLRSLVRIPPGAWMSVVSVVCCQVEVSATDWSRVQRSPTDSGASLCVIKKPRKRGGYSPLPGSENTPGAVCNARKTNNYC